MRFVDLTRVKRGAPLKGLRGKLLEYRDLKSETVSMETGGGSLEKAGVGGWWSIRGCANVYTCIHMFICGERLLEVTLEHSHLLQGL